MAQRPKLTPALVEQIETFGEKGKSSSWIAARTGVHEATVAYRMLRAGYDPWPGHKHGNNQKGGFSPEEDARILSLACEMGTHRIAQTIKRPYTSVRIRLMLLEVRAEKAVAA